MAGKVKKQRVYLAGPMRGKELFNFPAFNWTAKWLRKQGYFVWNPAERDIKEDGFNPKKDKPRPIKEYMVYDLPALCKCDAIVVLDGWELSLGASLEVEVARRLGMPVYDVCMREVVEKKAPPTVLQEADGLINGPRQASYGPPDQDFKRTADMWTALLQYKMKDGESIRPQDVSWMMMMLKASRAQQNDKRDNYVDAAGYAGCGWMCVEKGQAIVHPMVEWKPPGDLNEWYGKPNCIPGVSKSLIESIWLNGKEYKAGPAGDTIQNTRTGVKYNYVPYLVKKYRKEAK